MEGDWGRLDSGTANTSSRYWMFRGALVLIGALALAQAAWAGPEITPEVTPEITPEVTPEITPEVTPEVTPDVTPGDNGASCTDPDDCISGNCVDDVCCDTECDEPDQLCNLQGRVGMCTNVAAPAPTTSRTGLLIGLGVLTAIAAVALRRRELKHYLWLV